MKDIETYKTIIFDCDGVILNSNTIKTQAFYDAAKEYGLKEAEALKGYHIENGGISRFAKFEYFFERILNKVPKEDELENLIDNFASIVKSKLILSEVSDKLLDLRKHLIDSKWLVVSGGDQNELREVFRKKNIYELFDGGIFGSPDTKDEILSRESKRDNICRPALFLGDSKYDYLAAKNAKLDFIFVSEWSEVESWNVWTRSENIESVKRLSDLILR